LLGAPPESILRANQVRRAIGHVVLHGLFGRAPDPETERELLIEKALEEDAGGPAASDYNWYVTIVLERLANVAGGSVANRRYLWLDVGEATRLETELLAYARPYIDLLATGLTTLLDWTFFEEVTLEDRVFFSVPGHESFGLPELSVSASASVIKSGGSLDVGRLRQLLQGVASLPQSERLWLSSANHWHLAALRERDPWKRFLWSFLAMEILTNKLAAKLYDEVIRKLRVEGKEDGAVEPALVADVLVPKKKLSLVGNFAIVALAIFPDSAMEDVEAFRKVNTARNRLAHGDLKEERDLATPTLLGLLQRYMAAAMQF